jgi:hypothetical protein
MRATTGQPDRAMKMAPSTVVDGADAISDPQWRHPSTEVGGATGNLTMDVFHQ